jgi:hypothetical protein
MIHECGEILAGVADSATGGAVHPNESLHPTELAEVLALPIGVADGI